MSGWDEQVVVMKLHTRDNHLMTKKRPKNDKVLTCMRHLCPASVEKEKKRIKNRRANDQWWLAINER